mmetsp:Transcript_21247/g.34336  ORF Transcript_21247/g.34336 Transcript_21247/m.34336 type:complete len:355 (-) Transcript_21247:319-1383(-)
MWRVTLRFAGGPCESASSPPSCSRPRLPDCPPEASLSARGISGRLLARSSRLAPGAGGSELVSPFCSGLAAAGLGMPSSSPSLSDSGDSSSAAVLALAPSSPSSSTVSVAFVFAVGNLSHSDGSSMRRLTALRRVSRSTCSWGVMRRDGPSVGWNKKFLNLMCFRRTWTTSGWATARAGCSESASAQSDRMFRFSSRWTRNLGRRVRAPRWLTIHSMLSSREARVVDESFVTRLASHTRGKVGITPAAMHAALLERPVKSAERESLHAASSRLLATFSRQRASSSVSTEAIPSRMLRFELSLKWKPVPGSSAPMIWMVDAKDSTRTIRPSITDLWSGAPPQNAAEASSKTRLGW